MSRKPRSSTQSNLDAQRHEHNVVLYRERFKISHRNPSATNRNLAETGNMPNSSQTTNHIRKWHRGND